jgi:hypothetical protein
MGRSTMGRSRLRGVGLMWVELDRLKIWCCEECGFVLECVRGRGV